MLKKITAAFILLSLSLTGPAFGAALPPEPSEEIAPIDIITESKGDALHGTGEKEAAQAYGGPAGGYIDMPWDSEAPVMDKSLKYKEGIEDIAEGSYSPGGTGGRELEAQRSSYEAADELPEYYPKAHGDEAALLDYINTHLPPTRDQSPYGTCWAHSAMALGEVYGISHYGAGPSSMDYSELHLLSNSYKNIENPVVGDPAQGGSIAFTPKNGKSILDIGGNLLLAGQVLAKGIGYVEEASVPYTVDNLNKENNSALETSPFSDDKAHLKYAFRFNIKENPSLVKEAIRENGIVGASYYESSSYYDSSNNSYYNDVYTGSNHAVAIVGWDDSFPKSCFKSEPDSDGAWLIRNSWSKSSTASFSKNTYFWLSYCDKSLQESAYVFELSDSAGGYDHNYYYDLQLHNNSYYTSSINRCANVFRVPDDSEVEVLKEVQFEMPSSFAGGNYSLDIYTGLESNASPVKGVLNEESRMTGYLHFPGIYTIKLEKPVPLEAGSYFSVVLTTEGKSAAVELADSMDGAGGTVSWTVGIQPGQSFVSFSSDGEFSDLSSYNSDKEYGNFCICAHTSDSKLLTASKFTFTPPSSLVYDGKPHAASVTTELDAGSITVYYKKEGGAWTGTAPVSAGTYMVKIDASGSESYAAAKDIASGSWTFTIKKAGQGAVSISGDSSKTFGDGDFYISAEGGSGTGAYVYSSSDSGVLSVDSGTGLAHINGAGAATVSVYKAADDNYYNSGTASLDITVSKVGQGKVEISPEGLSDIRYGGGSFYLKASGGEGDGAYVYSSSDPDTLKVYPDGKSEPLRPGTASVSVYREGDRNHEESASSSTDIAIGKGRVTIKADDLSITAGDAMPALTYTVSGKADSDLLLKEPELSCAAGDTKSPGEYRITVSGAEIQNPDFYEGISYENGTLYIKAKDEDVTADKKTRNEVFKDASGGSFTLVHDLENNTYRTSSGQDVLVISDESGRQAEAPGYEYTSKKLTPGKDSFIVYKGAAYKYGTDYKLKFRKNKNAGSARVTVKWARTSAPYSGGEKSTSMVFTVLPKAVSENMVRILKSGNGKIKKMEIDDGSVAFKVKKKDFSYTATGSSFAIKFRNNLKGEVEVPQ